MAKLVSLKTWLALNYGEDAPSIFTARGGSSSGTYNRPPRAWGHLYVQPDAQ